MTGTSIEEVLLRLANRLWWEQRLATELTRLQKDTKA